MGNVTVNIIGKPGYSVIAKHRVGEDGTSVIDVCIEEIRTADQIAADVEAKMVASIKTGSSAVREVVAEHYGKADQTQRKPPPFPGQSATAPVAYAPTPGSFWWLFVQLWAGLKHRTRTAILKAGGGDNA